MYSKNLNLPNQSEKSQKSWWKKINWYVSTKVFIILVLIAAMIFAGWFTGTELNYNTKLGIDYTGGYQIQADVFDYTKKDTNFDTPNGDAKQGLYILKNKLDPIGDQPISLQKVGKHSVSVKASKSAFETRDKFVNAVDRMGSLFVIKQAADGSSGDSDLLISGSGTDKDPYKRDKIHDIFTGVSASINRARKPVVNLASTSKWLDLNKNNKDSKIWFWSDLGQMIDDLRNDFKNYENNKISGYRTYNQIISVWKNWVTNDKNDVDVGINQQSIFDYKYKDKNNIWKLGNFFRSIPSNYESFWDIVNNSTFQWTSVNYKQLTINPNEDSVSNDEVKYIIPFAKYARLFLGETMSSDVINRYKSYVFNYDPVVNDPNYKGSSSNVFVVKSQTESLKVSNLISGGLSGIVIKSNYIQNYDPIISSTTLTALKIVIAIVLVVVAVWLIVFYRLFGFLITITFISSIFMSFYLLAVLFVQVTPYSIAALALAFGVILFGLLLLINRYRKERISNQIPGIIAIKIAIKQTLPIIIDGLVLFIVLGLSMFWISGSEVKSFAISLLIGLFIGIVLMYALWLLFIYLFMSIKTLEKFKWLDVSSFGFAKLFKNKLFMKKNNADINGLNGTSVSPTNVDGSTRSDAKLVKENIEHQKSAKTRFFNKIFHWFVIPKWIPIVLVVFGVIAIGVGVGQVANFDQSIAPGSVYTIQNDIFGSLDPNPNVAANKEIEHIKNSLNTSSSASPYRHYNFQYSVINKVEDANDVSVMIWTNIINKNDIKGFHRWLDSISDGPITSITFNSSDPLVSTDLMISTIISLAIALIFVLIYTLFRLDWVQFVSILASALFVTALVLSIAIVVHISITFEMIAIFASIYCFSVVLATLIMAKAKQNKKTFNMDAYDDFFAYEYNYRKTVKLIKEKINYLGYRSVRVKAKELRSEDPYITKRQSISLAKVELKSLKNELNQVSNDAKVELKRQRLEFREYNEKNNFLYKAARMTARDLLISIGSFSIIMFVVFLFLAIFSGISYGLFVVLIIGILCGIWIPFVVAVPIWILLERYRALNKVKINNFIDSQHVQLDEQIVVGIND